MIVYVKADIDTCPNGEIKDFTGIDFPYEMPKNPEIHICNAHESIATSVDTIISYLCQHGYLNAL